LGSRSALRAEVLVPEAGAIRWQKQHAQAVTRCRERVEQPLVASCCLCRGGGNCCWSLWLAGAGQGFS